MELPPTFATALPGIELPPQAAMVAAKATKKAPGARNRNRMRITARRVAPSGRRLCRFADDGKQPVGCAYHGRKRLLRLVPHHHRQLGTTGLVRAGRHLLPQTSGGLRVEIQRCDDESATAQGDHTSACEAELDPGPLKRDEVDQRVRRRTEAVFELVAQR